MEHNIWHAVEELGGVSRLARRLERPRQTIYRWLRGERTCPALVVDAIRELTGGRVTAEDWHRVRLAYLRGRTGERAHTPRASTKTVRIPARSAGPDGTQEEAGA